MSLCTSLRAGRQTIGLSSRSLAVAEAAGAMPAESSGAAPALRPQLRDATRGVFLQAHDDGGHQGEGRFDGAGDAPRRLRGSVARAANDPLVASQSAVAATVVPLLRPRAAAARLFTARPSPSPASSL